MLPKIPKTVLIIVIFFIAILIIAFISDRNDLKKAESKIFSLDKSCEKDFKLLPDYPATPDTLKNYLVLLGNRYKDYRTSCLNPQASASADIDGIATITCGYGFKDHNRKLSSAGKLFIGASIEWKKPVSQLSRDAVIWAQAASFTCFQPLVDDNILTEQELDSIKFVQASEKTVNQAFKRGVPIGKKWIYYMISANSEEDISHFLQEK